MPVALLSPTSRLTGVAVKGKAIKAHASEVSLDGLDDPATYVSRRGSITSARDKDGPSPQSEAERPTTPTRSRRGSYSGTNLPEEAVAKPPPTAGPSRFAHGLGFEGQGLSAAEIQAALSHVCGSVMSYDEDEETSPVCRMHSTVKEALAKLDATSASMVTIVNDAGTVQGMLTRKDLERIREKRKGRADAMTLDYFIDAPPVVVNVDTHVQAAAALMLAYGVTELAVVDRSNQILGFVSHASLIKPMLGGQYATFLPLFAARPYDEDHAHDDDSIAGYDDMQHASIDEANDIALDDAFDNAVKALNDALHTKINTDDLPGAKFLSDLMHQAAAKGAAATAAAAAGENPHGSQHFADGIWKCLYDGDCVIYKTFQAVLEKLAHSDTQVGHVQFVDVASSSFMSVEHANVTYNAAMETVHAISSAGMVLKGLPAVMKLFSVASQTDWSSEVSMLPLLAPVMSLLYTYIMHNRHQLAPVWGTFLDATRLDAKLFGRSLTSSQQQTHGHHMPAAGMA